MAGGLAGKMMMLTCRNARGRPFVLALSDPAKYQAVNPVRNYRNGDGAETIARAFALRES